MTRHTLTIEAETLKAVLGRIGSGPAVWLPRAEVLLLGHTRRHMGGARYEIEADVPDWLVRRLMPLRTDQESML